MADELEDFVPPELDEYDKAAAIGLLIRVMRIDQANTADQAIIDELQAAVAARTAPRAKLVQAFSALGFDTGAGIWKRVKLTIGEEAYSKAWKIASPTDRPPSEGNAGQIERHDDGDAAARSEDRQAVPRIADAILGHLRALEGRGAQVSEIKKHLLDAYGIATHEKTPGMTLYRLSKDGLVRRDGRSWFATEKAKGVASESQATLPKKTAADQ